MNEDLTATRFFDQLAASAPGRRHLLSLAVAAEEGDEAGIFDQLAERVEGERFRRIVERHRDDEVRHARLFRRCLARLGLAPVDLPAELRIVGQVAAEVAGERRVRTRDDVVASYATLLAIEQRGVEQFPLIAAAFDPVDPETAAVYRRVARDERGHVRYCELIGRHHAGDDAAWHRAVAGARAAEEEAFVAVGLANLLYCTERGWVPAA
jgi:rubrerythrin